MKRVLKISLVVIIVGLAGSSYAGTYGGGTGTESDPYKIADANDMNEIGAHPEDWGSHFLLVNDINLAEYTGEEFNIIGNEFTPFTGTFDGNGHTISNFTYINPGALQTGLFRVVDGPDAIIQDLVLIEPTIDAGYPTAFSGGLVSDLRNATLLNCGVEGGVIIAGEVYTGGLAGHVYGGLIENCYATIQVDGGLGPPDDYFSSYVGGLIGNCINSTILNSYATGAVSGEAHVGGLIGKLSGTILNCYSNGSVSGGLGEIGGLVGSNSGEIFNCYSLGSVSGGDDSSRLGGLVGSNDGAIINCYAAGVVSGGDNSMHLGGICGVNWGSDTISNCFWDIETSGTTDGVGDVEPDPVGVTGKTTAEMQTASTFTTAGWDFIDIWNIGENQTYPYLRIVPGSDINKDRITNLLDFAILAERWLVAH